MSKQFFFEAGAFPDLSYVELIAVLESFNISKDIGLGSNARILELG